MTVAVVDNRISEKIGAALLNYADLLLPLPPHPSLPYPVASHPDMLLWQYGKTIITYEDYLPIAKNVFKTLEDIGYKILTASQSPTDKYPFDVRLNCAVVGRNVICNEKYADSRVLDTVYRNKLKLIHANQGYAKCSTLPISETALITADVSIYNSTKKASLDALLITQGNVRLDGYDTGFIGGATGVLNNTVFFCGDVSLHPDGDKIVNFCSSYNKNAVCLSNQLLYDYGTVFFFEDR